MLKRNESIHLLGKDYLFVEIAKRKREFLDKNPTAKLISLGVGDTTEPIPKVIVEALVKQAKNLGDKEGYLGYGDPFGREDLRSKIAEKFYGNRVTKEEIFISDGSKPDIARLQFLFSREAIVALQDPSYPVYKGSTILGGKKEPISIPSTDFIPDLKKAPFADIIYLVNPNNPTGQVFTREALSEMVQIAKERGSIIIYDSAYAAYIQDKDLPRSIYEIEGSQAIAIETGSFSKFAGFTGVRLGWTVVPKALGVLHDDWRLIVSSLYNGASNIAQAGGLAALTDEGMESCDKICKYYLENAATLKRAITQAGYSCYGADHAPFLFVDLKKRSSWEVFDALLQKAHLVTTPGLGFGPAGEGYIRLSAFGDKALIQEASKRLTSFFKQL